MAPLLGSPMTQTLTSTKSNPNRPFIPIVPAIPRSLDKTYKKQISIASISHELPQINSPLARESDEQRHAEEKSVTPTQITQSDEQSEIVGGDNTESEDLKNERLLSSTPEQTHATREGTLEPASHLLEC